MPWTNCENCGHIAQDHNLPGESPNACGPLKGSSECSCPGYIGVQFDSHEGPKSTPTVPAEQYSTNVKMQYSAELSGNWIWQADPTLDDEMRAVVQIHDGSPLFNPDGSWNSEKLRQLSAFLLALAK